MQIKFRKWAEQLLLAFNLIIAFLFLFEDQLVLPAWLQAFGRMHPLLLHFPIVLLLMAMLLEFFRFKSQNAVNPLYEKFLDLTLLGGTWLAAITVVMGLFLAREEGYGGTLLNWHKWTGVGIFYLSSCIYFLRNSTWYRSVIARLAAIVLCLGLVLTGHYGAALTHGENFITEPFISQQKANPVTLEEAVVYHDVIKPILEQKCISCHNPEKLKGQLILSDPSSLKKGGKSGALYVPGKPEISLMMERIHLPVEDKKHMPPSGKAQLTPDETILLSLWIKQNADFTMKLIELPNTDSLRIIAVRHLKPADAADIYDFDPVGEETIAKLNNDYRTITPLAKDSPALSVNIYNRNEFNGKQLEELDAVKKQVVTLNLNKLPVKDIDLKSVAKLENLRRLDLNFTDITATGLQHLVTLKHLKYLSISGTKLDFAALGKVISSIGSLKAITLWETNLTPEQIAQLQKNNRTVSVIGGFVDDGKNPLKLNLPEVKNASMVFATELSVQLKHSIKGVDLRYTTDGSEPDSIASPIFDGKMVLHEPATLKVRAYKAGWFGSDVATFDFYRGMFKPDSVKLLAPLNRVHQAEGAHTFFDHKLGVIGANNPAWANNWAGVRDNDMDLLGQFYKPVKISSVGIRYMTEEDTGIFPPGLIEVWGGNNPDQLKLLGKVKAKLPVKGEVPSLKSIEVKFSPETVTFLKIVGKPLTEIPDWHRNKGKRALLLVDEMFIN